MESPKQPMSKIFLGLAGLCLVAVFFIFLSAGAYEPEKPFAGKTANTPEGSESFDHEGETIFENYNKITQIYLSSGSSERTLEEYYYRRQFPGSPPVIPHPADKKQEEELECLTCHAKGGWTQELKRHTPLTPHPDMVSCRQCHVRPEEATPFQANTWLSIPPPRLGNAHLPGGPSPIPHTLQLRGSCIACHTGPGAVTAIRVEHPLRGNCRQCHVPDNEAKLFKRNP